MSLVVDASLAARWILPDEMDTASDEILGRLISAPALVPSLFWFELRNVLLVAERRGRLRPGEAARSMLELRALPLQDEGTGRDEAVLGLALRRDLSAYDAAYLALAIDRRVPLATADRRLAGAARAEQVPVDGPFG